MSPRIPGLSFSGGSTVGLGGMAQGTRISGLHVRCGDQMGCCMSLTERDGNQAARGCTWHVAS